MELIDNTQYYDIAEVAKVLNKHWQTIHRFIKEDKMESILVDQKRYVSHKELVKHLHKSNLPASMIDYRLHGKKLVPQSQTD